MASLVPDTSDTAVPESAAPLGPVESSALLAFVPGVPPDTGDLLGLRPQYAGKTSESGLPGTAAPGVSRNHGPSRLPEVEQAKEGTTGLLPGDQISAGPSGLLPGEQISVGPSRLLAAEPPTPALKTDTVDRWLRLDALDQAPRLQIQQAAGGTPSAVTGHIGPAASGAILDATDWQVVRGSGPLAQPLPSAHGATDAASSSLETRLPARSVVTQARDARAAFEMAAADGRPGIAAQAGTDSSQIAVLLADSKADTHAKSAQRTAPSPFSVAASPDLPGPWANPAPVAGQAHHATFSVDGSAATPELAVADKLNYWVSRGVQNAQLQLDSFGGGAVDVSITVNGSEALVEFRSDQPEARRLLQDAMPHLKEMLRAEGMVLSGGFVGTSARQDPGAQRQQGNPQSRTSQSASVEPKTIQAVSQPVLPQGRTLDVFV
jgi:hypothetical protein